MIKEILRWLIPIGAIGLIAGLFLLVYIVGLYYYDNHGGW